MPSPITEAGFSVLRDAVRLAREEQIQGLTELRNRLLERGYTPELVDEALRYWSNYAITR